MTDNKGDLISRENLREQIDDCEYFNSSFQKMTVAEFLTIVHDLIENAPTVEYPFYREAYQTGYEEGKNERPQGKKIQTPSCLTNPERHEELLERYKEVEDGKF